MASIPSFGESLLANPPAKQVSPTKVEDILNSTPAPQPVQTNSVPETKADTDTFTNTQAVPANQRRRSLAVPVLSSIAGLGALFFAGRKGWLGKTVKTWFGGRLSMDKLNKKIADQLQEYMSRYGNVRNVNIENNSLIKVEMENGTVREFRLVPKKGNKIIQYESKPTNNRREVIQFSAEDASPLYRVQFKLDNAGNSKGYVSYKGGDILSKDFDEVSQMYKKSSTKVRPRLWLDVFKFGPIKAATKTRKFDTMEPEGFWAKIKDFFTDSSKNISSIKNKYFRGSMTKSEVTNHKETKIFAYDDNGNVKRIHVKPKTKGVKDFYEQYEYTKAIVDGKEKYLLTNIKMTSDKAGKKPI